MNNETMPSPSDYSQLVSDGIMETQLTLSPFALLIYASILQFPDEIEYIWRQRFSLPTILYLLSKYPLLVSQALGVAQFFLPETASISLCNDINYLVGIMGTLPFIGVQGLISARTYSLCRGYRPMTIALFITFFISLSLEIYTLTIPNCLPAPADFFIFPLISGISVIISDLLAFMVVIHQVWGLWKFKRSIGLQSGGDLVTSLLRQGTLRFCFVLLISATVIILYQTTDIGSSLGPFQNVLSTILMCEFTIDLRRRNENSSSQSALTLPNLSFQDNPVQSIQSLFGRLHENVIAEMGEKNHAVDGGPRSQELYA